MASSPYGAPFKIVLRDLPLPVRLTLSLFLLSVGLGYFSALAQLHFKNASRGEPLPTPNDVVEIFSGVENWPAPKPAPPKPVSKMERLIMADENLPHNASGTMAFAFFGTGRQKVAEDKRKFREGERLAIQAWIDAPDEQRKEAYESDAFPLPESLANQPITKDYVDGDKVKVKSIIDARCLKCHMDASQEGKKALVEYSDFADVLAVPQVGHTSRQMSLESLTQTTHLHLLTFCVLWTMTGLVFTFSGWPKWLRCVLAPLVLLAQVADVACWWLARLTDPFMSLPHGLGPYFALGIIGAGAVVGIGLFLQIVLSLFDMYRTPGRIVLLLLFVASGAGGALVYPHIQKYLNDERTPAVTAPAEPSPPEPAAPK